MGCEVGRANNHPVAFVMLEICGCCVFSCWFPCSRADELTKKMMARVSEEAEAFQRLAPEVLGEETLHQRSLKPAGRFHPRIGNAAMSSPKPEWQERTIVSEYGFTAFGADSSSLHEIRQVTSVDGKKIEDTKKAQAALAKAITATDDARKKQLLKQFEKYGLLGAVTDYGQALLLFTRRSMERYEFTARGVNSLNGQPSHVFGYRQIDGPETVTLIEENQNDQVKHLRIEGELWVRTDNFVPVRIIMVATQGEGPDRVKEEASIDYAMSSVRRAAAREDRASGDARRENRRGKSVQLLRTSRNSGRRAISSSTPPANENRLSARVRFQPAIRQGALFCREVSGIGRAVRCPRSSTKEISKG